MAFTANAVWEVRSDGSDTLNGGGFDPGVTGMATDLAATSATTAAPVVTSASYSFVAGDVGAWLFIKSGTDWTPGWYKIVSVSGGAATLSAGSGQGILYLTTAGTYPYYTTSSGCATAASPTSGTWSIDYSQQAAAQVSFTDMVIGNPTTTQFTSAATPGGKNLVGNLVNVTGGTGFTVQVVAITAWAASVYTVDKTLGTASSTGGVGGLGGAFLTISKAGGLAVNGAATTQNPYLTTQKIHIRGGSGSPAVYGIAAGLSFGQINLLIEGYGTVRHDLAAKPIIRASAASITLISYTAADNGCVLRNVELDGNSLASVNGFGHSTAPTMIVERCVARNCPGTGFTVNTLAVECHRCLATACGVGFNVASAFGCDAISCTSHGFTSNGISPQFVNCKARANGGRGFSIGDGRQSLIAGCTARSNTSDGFNFNGRKLTVANCLAYGNGAWGFNGGAVLYNCAFGSNTSGNVQTALQINCVTLTADPHTSATDLSPNNVAGGGAAIRAAGIPGPWPDGTTTGYPDIGAVQHQDSGGGGGLIGGGNLSGGLL